MRYKLASSTMALAAMAFAPGLAPQAQEADGGFATFVEGAGTHWGVLEEYCITCHNFTDFAAELALDLYSPEEVPQDAEIWEKVLRKLRGRTMPPPGEDRPTNDQYQAMVDWFEGYLDAAAAQNPNPGYVGLHRLNRKEYTNAIYDLLGVNWFGADALLPADSSYEGFDNIAEHLVVSPDLVNAYLGAAHEVAVTALGNPRALLGEGSGAYLTNPDAEGHQAFHMHGAPLGTRGGLLAWHYFPVDGEYEINMEGFYSGDAWYNMIEQMSTIVVTVNGRLVFWTNLGGYETGDLFGITRNPGPTLTEMNERIRDIRFHAEAGPALVYVGFLNRSLLDGEDELAEMNPMGGTHRALGMVGFGIVGPFDSDETVSPMLSRDLIFSCYPQSTAEESACATEILSNLASRAFRRPVTDAEMAFILDFYDVGLEVGGFEEGIRAGITRILASPQFLVRSVTPAPEREVAPGAGIYWLDDYELASRLSFFLWSSIPDAELLALAEAGTLRDPEVLAAQVLRMLADERSFSLASNFAYQWLHLEKVWDLEPDPKIFPYAAVANTSRQGADADPRPDLMQEILLFVDMIFREDRSVVELLSASDTYLNERTAAHYGIDTVKGSRFRQVELEDSSRWGLLGKGAALMVTSYPDRTAPVLRGEWILSTFIGAPPSPPPPTVEALLPENDVANEVFLSVAERLRAHSTDPACYACHGIMDPLGFALENFNAVGVWREREEFTGQPLVTDAGVLPDGTPLTSPDEVREYLLQRPEQFVQAFTEKFFMYATGRPIIYQQDMPTIRSIVAQAAEDDFQFSSLVLALVTSDAFLQYKLPAGTEAEAPVQALDYHLAPESWLDGLLEAAATR